MDIADGAIASMSGTTSQPNLNSIVAALQHTTRDTGLDLDALNQCADYWEAVRELLRAVRHRPEVRHRRGLPARDARRPVHQPARSRPKSMGLGDRWHEIARTYADVNMAFGDIVKVTPSSKVVGDMALFLVSHGMTMRRSSSSSAPDHNLTLPNVGGRDVHGLARRAGGRLAEAAAEDHPARREAAARAVRARTCRRSISTRPQRSSRRRSAASRRATRRAELPDVSRGVPEVRDARGSSTATSSVLPTPQFFYGMQRGEEIAVEIEPGKTLIIKFLTVGEPHPDGTRTVFFELNGQPREVTIRDRVAGREASSASRRPTRRCRARSARRFPGVVSTVAVRAGAEGEEGRPAAGDGSDEDADHGLRPGAGTVAEVLVEPGSEGRNERPAGHNPVVRPP